MENNFIVLIVGASGSGKTTLAENLERLFGWRPVVSYTTRPRRSENEAGHIFVDDYAFDEAFLSGAVAYTEYSGYRYCATQRQAEEAQTYVVDIPGVEYFRKKYTGSKKVLTVFLDLPEDVRRERMLMRGDTDTVEKRLETDRAEFSREQSKKLRPDLVISEAYPLAEETAIVHHFVCSKLRQENASTQEIQPDVKAAETSDTENQLEQEKGEQPKNFVDDPMDYLRRAVLAKRSILICSEEESDRLDFLNRLIRYIPEDEKTVAVEKDNELNLGQLNDVVRLEMYTKYRYGKFDPMINRGKIKIAIRMHPDRIVTNGFFKDEVQDIVSAMGTKSYGVITSVAAGSTEEAASKMKDLLVEKTGIAWDITSIPLIVAMDVIVHVGKAEDGSLRVLGMSDVMGLDKRTEEISLRQLYSIENDPDHRTKDEDRFISDKSGETVPSDKADRQMESVDDQSTSKSIAYQKEMFERVEDIMDKLTPDEIIHHVIVRLCRLNESDMRKMPDGIVYEPVADDADNPEDGRMTLLYHFDFSYCGFDGVFLVPLTKQMLGKLNQMRSHICGARADISMEDLRSYALMNLLEKGHVVLQSLRGAALRYQDDGQEDTESWLVDPMKKLLPDYDIYALYSTNGFPANALILSKGVQRIIRSDSSDLSERFYILPSTNNKLLFVSEKEIGRKEGIEPADELKMIADTIHRVIGPSNSVYGNHVYEICKNGNELRTVI